MASARGMAWAWRTWRVRRKSGDRSCPASTMSGIGRYTISNPRLGLPLCAVSRRRLTEHPARRDETGRVERDEVLPGGWSQDDRVKDGVGAILHQPGWPRSARPEDLHAPFSVDVTKVPDSTAIRMLHTAPLDSRMVYIGVLPSRSPAVGSVLQFAAMISPASAVRTQCCLTGAHGCSRHRGRRRSRHLQGRCAPRRGKGGGAPQHAAGLMDV